MGQSTTSESSSLITFSAVRPFSLRTTEAAGYSLNQTKIFFFFLQAWNRGH